MNKEETEIIYRAGLILKKSASIQVIQCVHAICEEMITRFDRHQSIEQKFEDLLGVLKSDSEIEQGAKLNAPQPAQYPKEQEYPQQSSRGLFR